MIEFTAVGFWLEDAVRVRESAKTKLPFSSLRISKTAALNGKVSINVNGDGELDSNPTILTRLDADQVTRLKNLMGNGLVRMSCRTGNYTGYISAINTNASPHQVTFFIKEKLA